MASAEPMMQAVQVHVPGGPDALVLAQLPLPQPGPGEVRVQARAIGVGGPDVLIRNGSYKWMPPLPAIPGNEMAGVVDALGAGVTGLAVGQRVLVSSRELPQRGGCYAQALCVPADALFHLPDNVGFGDAMSLGNFQLAQAMLQSCSGAMGVRSALLPGAAGGVATALTQLARAQGITVVGTASSAAKRDFALANGASTVLLDADPASLPARVLEATGGRGVDLAFDHVGGALFVACLRSLADFGCAVSYNILSGAPNADVFQELRTRLAKSLAVRTFSIHSWDHDRAARRALMERAIELMAAGRIQAPPATLLPLTAARHAHELLDGGRTLGKIILEP
ncbi:MAG: zinc-dependent alcohol dehydrogenase family protein [Rubrivivax sp.]|nr:zinc-dependent alcohol dehydrogenase family protein [Rubrivivax sp.]